MSTSNRTAYHHGALKAALIAAADALLDEGGAGAVSLRQAARRAGVSATAPYRHFADKEALLAAIAVRGFLAFGEALGAAAEGADRPLAAMGQAYIRFALARPGRFRLMFGPAGIADRSRYPELKAAANRTHEQLVAAVGRRHPGAADAELEIAAIASWALVHGLAHLLLDGMLPGVDPEAIARAITSERRANAPERH
jgi:AcrR family transcriptional regulator